MDSRISSIESTLSSIQSQVNSGHVLTSVTPVEGGVQIVIDGQTYTITNGKDGKDGATGATGATGANGKDGQNGKDSTSGIGTVWTIGDDGYWYENGKKTEYTAVDEDGPCYSLVGPEGELGTWWEVADPDDTSTWENTGISYYASGDSSDAVSVIYDKANGMITFYNVKDGEGNVISEDLILYLTTELRSLVFIPDVYYGGVPAISYTKSTALKVDKKDTNDETWKEDSGSSVISDIVAKYHINPSNAKITADNELAFVGEDVAVKSAASKDLKVTATFKEQIGDTLFVSVSITGTPATVDKEDDTKSFLSIRALQVTTDDGTITSDYATFYTGGDSDNADWKAVYPASASAGRWNSKMTKGGEEEDDKEIDYSYKSSIGDVKTHNFTVAYDESVQLDTLIAVVSDKKTLDLEALGLAFDFELYKGENSDYNYVNAESLKKGVFTPTGYSSINKAPIVRALLKKGNDVILVAYMKIQIITGKSDAYEIATGKTFSLTATTFTTTDAMFESVFEATGLSSTSFKTLYNSMTDNDDDIGSIIQDKSLTELKWTLEVKEIWENADETETKTISHTVTYSNDDGSTVTVTLTASLAPIVKTVAAAYVDINWDQPSSNNYVSVDMDMETDDDTQSFQGFDLSTLFEDDYTADLVDKKGDLSVAVKYFFTKENERTVTLSDGRTILIKLDAVTDSKTKTDSSKLRAQLFASGTTAKWDNSKDSVEIATISNTDDANTVACASSDDAKKIISALLDAGEMKTYISAKAVLLKDKKVIDGNACAFTITFNDAAYFTVEFLPPVTISSVESDDNYLDLNLLFEEGKGATGSYINCDDLFSIAKYKGGTFSDWGNVTIKFGDDESTWIWDDDRKESKVVKGGTASDDEVDVSKNITLTYDETKSVKNTDTEKEVEVKSNLGFLTGKKGDATAKTNFYVYLPVTVTYNSWYTVTTTVKVLVKVN